MEDKEKEKELPKKQEKSVFDLAAIPTNAKVIMVAILFAGILFKVPILMIILGIIIVWFFYSQETVKMGDMLTPEEALLCVRQKINHLKVEGLIPRNVEHYISDNYSIHYSSAVPKHYTFGVQFMYDDMRRSNKIFRVYASGIQKGFCVVNEGIGKFRGDEEPHIKDFIPTFFKKLKKYDLDKYFMHR